MEMLFLNLYPLMFLHPYLIPPLFFTFPAMPLSLVLFCYSKTLCRERWKGEMTG